MVANSREVVFSLRVSGDAARKEMRSFGSAIVKEQERISREVAGVQKKVSNDVAKDAKAAATAQTREAQLAAREGIRAAREVEREHKRIARDQKALNQEYERDQKKKAKSIADAAKKAADEEEAAYQASLKSFKEANRENEREFDRSLKAKAAKARAAKREDDKAMGKLVGGAKADGVEAANAAIAGQRRLEAATLRSEAAQRKFGLSMRQALNDGAEGLASMVRGFGLLGLVGTKESEELAQGLLKVQAGFDLLRGGVKIYASLGQAADAYRAKVAATAAIEQASALSRLRSGRAGMGSIAGSYGGQAIAGRGLAGAGVGAAGAGGALPAAAAAAVASIVVAGKVIYESLTGSATKVGSWSNTIAESEVKFVNWIGKATGFFDLIGDKANEAREKRRGEADERSARIENDIFAESNYRESDRQRRLESGLLRERIGGAGRDQSSPEARRAGVAGQSYQTQQALNLALGDKAMARTADERKAAEERILDLRKRLVELDLESLDVERSIADEKKEGARASIAGAERELDLARQRSQEARDKLQSGASRFASLDKGEQQRAIRAKKILDEADTQEKNGDAASAEKTRARVGREDLNLVRGLGLTDTDRQAGQADREAATRGGFDQFFGAGERNTIAENQQLQGKLEARIKDQREYVVKVEADIDAIATRLAQQTKEELDRRDAELDVKFRQALKEERSRGARQTRQEAIETATSRR